ncbi:MAG: hypothetical protein DRI24_06355, partial [Deltaproteobacteria bacterium]
TEERSDLQKSPRKKNAVGHRTIAKLLPLKLLPRQFLETMGSGLHFSQFRHNVKSEGLTPIYVKAKEQ